MNLLLKYPTRARPRLMDATIARWLELAGGRHALRWLVSLDYDDPQLAECLDVCRKHGIDPYLGHSKTKIEAINADLDYAGEFDVMVNVSDDMRPLVKGWDDLVAACLPDLDFGVWFPDGRRTDLCTLSIFGRGLFERMNRWVYHPAFVTVWADNHYQHVAQRWGRLKFVNCQAFVHEWRKENNDALMQRNEDRNLFAADQQTYNRLVAEFAAGGEAFPCRT